LDQELLEPPLDDDVLGVLADTARLARDVLDMRGIVTV
jgi:hypothetical protein